MYNRSSSFCWRICAKSNVLEGLPSSFFTKLTNTHKHTTRTRTIHTYIHTDIRIRKWTQDNNITSIIAYTRTKRERMRMSKDKKNTKHLLTLYSHRHNRKHTYSTNTRIFNQQINEWNTKKNGKQHVERSNFLTKKKKTVEGNYQNNGICHSQSHQVEVVINQHWWRANTPNWKKKTKQQNTNFSVFGFKFPSDRSEMRTTRNTRTTQKLKIRKEKNKMSKGKHFRSIQTKYHSKEREREKNWNKNWFGKRQNLENKLQTKMRNTNSEMIRNETKQKEKIKEQK